jgi:uncharacterized membrane protein
MLRCVSMRDALVQVSCRSDIFSRLIWFIVLKGIYTVATNVVIVTVPKMVIVTVPEMVIVTVPEMFCCCDSTALSYPKGRQ